MSDSGNQTKQAAKVDDLLSLDTLDIGAAPSAAPLSNVSLLTAQPTASASNSNKANDILDLFSTPISPSSTSTTTNVNLFQSSATNVNQFGMSSSTTMPNLSKTDNLFDLFGPSTTSANNQPAKPQQPTSNSQNNVSVINYFL